MTTATNTATTTTTKTTASGEGWRDAGGRLVLFGRDGDGRARACSWSLMLALQSTMGVSRLVDLVGFASPSGVEWAGDHFGRLLSLCGRASSPSIERAGPYWTSADQFRDWRELGPKRRERSRLVAEAVAKIFDELEPPAASPKTTSSSSTAAKLERARGVLEDARKATRHLGLRDRVAQERFESSRGDLHDLILPKLRERLGALRIWTLDDQSSSLCVALKTHARVHAIAKMPAGSCNGRPCYGLVGLLIKTTRSSAQRRRPAYRLSLSLGEPLGVAKDYDYLKRIATYPGALLGPSIAVVAVVGERPGELALHCASVDDVFAIVGLAADINRRWRRESGQQTIKAIVSSGRTVDLGHVRIKPSNQPFAAFVEVDVWAVDPFEPVIA